MKPQENGRTITQAERRELDRLITNARGHLEALDTIHAAVVAITGDPDPENGHAADATYGVIGASMLLKKLGVKVKVQEV